MDFYEKRKKDIEEKYIFKPQVYIHLAPKKDLMGAIEDKTMAFVNYLARNKTGLHIKTDLVVGDYTTNNSEHAHLILSATEKLSLQKIRKLLRTDKFLQGKNQIKIYDNRLAGGRYMYSSHREIHTHLSCPSGGACRKRHGKQSFCKYIRKPIITLDVDVGD